MNHSKSLEMPIDANNVNCIICIYRHINGVPSLCKSQSKQLIMDYLSPWSCSFTYLSNKYFCNTRESLLLRNFPFLCNKQTSILLSISTIQVLHILLKCRDKQGKLGKCWIWWYEIVLYRAKESYQHNFLIFCPSCWLLSLRSCNLPFSSFSFKGGSKPAWQKRVTIATCKNNQQKPHISKFGLFFFNNFPHKYFMHPCTSRTLQAKNAKHIIKLSSAIEAIIKKVSCNNPTRQAKSIAKSVRYHNFYCLSFFAARNIWFYNLTVNKFNFLKGMQILLKNKMNKKNRWYEDSIIKIQSRNFTQLPNQS